MSRKSKYVISYFTIKDSNEEYKTLMDSIKKKEGLHEEDIGRFKWRILNFKELTLQKGLESWKLYSGHFDIFKDTKVEQCNPSENKETPFITKNLVKEKDVFIIANPSNEFIIAHRVNTHINNSINDFRKKFKRLCDDKIDFDFKYSSDIFNKITACKRISSIYVKFSSNYLHVIDKINYKDNINFSILKDIEFSKLTEIVWNEKESHNMKYGENLINFSITYLGWIKNKSNHSPENLEKYLKESNNQASLRTIEEAVILSIVVNNPECKIRGYDADGNEIIIDLEAIIQQEKIIEVLADKNKDDEVIAHQIIEKLKALK